MASLILAVSLGALFVALGEYVFYNAIVALAGMMRRPELDPGFTPRITAIIPAHNEEGHIRRKLENLLDSDYPEELLEVIVVDDGSTDRTAEIVGEFDGVRLLQTGGRKGKITAQKLAFEQAATEIVAITDATVLTAPDALRKMAAHMSDPRVGAVSASMSVRNRDANYMTRVSQFLFDIQNAQKLGESRLDSIGGLFGQMSLVRRAAIGDFSTDVIYEDREFGITLRRRGYRARIEPDAAAYYYAPESLGDFSTQKRRNVGAMTQSIVRHRSLLFNPRYGLYGLLIFPEYSLFRVLRPYLLALSFMAAAVYCFLFDPGALVALFASMAVAVLGCYVLGTTLLAPLVTEPRRFMLDIFAMIPAMALVALHLLTAGAGYFTGGYSAKWKRVKRDPERVSDEDSSA
jgi:cellulose synthase/poly-beta-1,6-N-acetylglucosamine synthase-like glycosyltransferase